MPSSAAFFFSNLIDKAHEHLFYLDSHFCLTGKTFTVALYTFTHTAQRTFVTGSCQKALWDMKEITKWHGNTPENYNTFFTYRLH